MCLLGYPFWKWEVFYFTIITIIIYVILTNPYNRRIMESIDTMRCSRETNLIFYWILKNNEYLFYNMRAIIYFDFGIAVANSKISTGFNVPRCSFVEFNLKFEILERKTFRYWGTKNDLIMSVWYTYTSE